MGFATENDPASTRWTFSSVRRFFLGLWFVAALGACGQAPPPDERDGGTDGGVELLKDKTVLSVRSTDEFFSLARPGPSRSALKFVLTKFHEEVPEIRYMDSRFYSLHDEWWWFNLLNGWSVPGSQTAPVTGLSFSSIAEVYEWARARSPLPLDLRFTGDDRLYSPGFYTSSFGPNRSFGLGTIIHIPAKTEGERRPPVFAFELEYGDSLSHRELVAFFEAQIGSLPADIGEKLVWVIRSPSQEALARTMEEQRLRYHDRVVRYRDLIVKGETEVYSAGLTAGRLLFIRRGEDVSKAREGDILVVEDLPDALPTVAGLISGVPQTPLAHINILAKNRAIPNAYLAGALDDPEWDQLARVRAPVIVRAMEPNALRIEPISEAQYQTWLNMRTVPPVRIRDIDLASIPLALDLSTVSFDNVDALRPVIGGKSAGFLGIAQAQSVPTVDRPVAITVKSYAEHLASFRPAIVAMFNTVEFVRDPRIRFLVLEGASKFDARYRDVEDQAEKQRFLASRPEGDPVGVLVSDGGLKTAIRSKPIADETMKAIHAFLTDHFSRYETTQGLRFRSSSTVEDIEGFNGAGLYDSNTGFLDAAAQPRAEDQKRTVEWALKKTWASYWNFAAFEERRAENIDHQSGSMGVFVHARSDDDDELMNAVITMTLLPESHDAVARMVLNAQLGSESVTNPVPGSGALPEIAEVVLRRGAPSATITRIRPSTRVAAGEKVVDDDALLDMFGHTHEVIKRWLFAENRVRSLETRSQTLTLDFEMKRMAAGWPAVRFGPEFPERLVFKQARTLEPGLRRVPAPVAALPVPRDILARAKRVVAESCESDSVVLNAFEVYTQPLMVPDFGYGEVPFSAKVEIVFQSNVPVLGRGAGDRVDIVHTQVASVAHPGMEGAGPWSLRLVVKSDAAQTKGIDEIVVGADREFSIRRADATYSSGFTRCARVVLYTTPNALLEDWLSADGEP